MKTKFLCGGELYTVLVHKKEGRTIVTVGDQVMVVDAHVVSPHWMSLLIGNQIFNVYGAEADGKQFVSIRGENYVFTIPGDEQNASADRTRETKGEAKLIVTAPMPGNVLKILVGKGEPVSEGQCLAIVEAMKMETSLVSTINGRVKRVCVEEGQQVDAGQLLVELEEGETSKKV